MKPHDDQLLSLYLDGRLAREDAVRLEARLAAEPELRAHYDALVRLQQLSENLAPTSAGFGAQHIRTRMADRPWKKYGGLAAAALVLVATHFFAFRLGTDSGSAAMAVERSPIESTEDLFERAARIDPAAEPSLLRSELGELESEIQTLRPELIAFADGNGEVPPARRLRAAELSRALGELEGAFTAQDIGFVGFTVRAFAQGRVGLLPATTQNFARVMPSGKGRVRIVILRVAEGTPRIVTDEGTPEELEGRHADIQFISHKEK